MKQLFITLAFIGAAHAQDFPAEVVRPGGNLEEMTLL